MATAAALHSDIAYLARTHKMFALAAGNAGEISITLRPEGFPTLLQLILEQQVSTTAARTMFSRLQRTINPIEPRAFLQLGDEDMASCGFSRQKAGYGRELATAILDGSFDPDTLGGLADGEVVRRLTALRGIGSWTAENYLLWALGRRDVFPAGDLALQVEWQKLTGSRQRPSTDELREIASAWRPRRSAAALLIWHSYLGTGENPASSVSGP